MGQYQQKTPEFLIEYVKRISTILQDDFIAAKLYGSFARGEQTDDSDIDIVIFTKKTQDQYMVNCKLNLNNHNQETHSLA